MNDAPPNQPPQGPAPASGPADCEPPRIPDHTLLRRIGRGSYGEVWLARSVLAAYRAVKIVYRRSFEHDRPYEREFNGIQKFEPLSRSHEGFIDILQAGRNDPEGYFYYIMELADDESSTQPIDPATYKPRTLGKDVTQRRRLPFPEWLKLGLSLSSAVADLHRHGLIHRDIKPSNIIFVNGVPKLADIGLVTDADSPTIPGGTLGYIAPEGMPSPQADIYSLGKVLYELCTGKDRMDFPDLPTRVDTEEDPTKLAEANEVILRACEADVRKRYQSAADMHADLVLLESGKSVKRLRVLERRLALFTKAALVALVLALVGAAAYYQAYRARRDATQRLASSFVGHGTRSLDDGDLFGSLPWFTEALLLHQGDKQQEHQDRVRLAVALRQCPRILNLWFEKHAVKDAQFSPDGRYVVTAAGQGSATVWDTETGTVVHHLEGHSPGRDLESAAFSPDGRFIVTASGDHTVRVWDAQTGQEITDPLDHPRAVYCARFHPDGTRVVTGCADGLARLWDLATGEPVVVFEKHQKEVSHAVLSPDGHRLVTSSHDTTAQVWDVATGRAIGPRLRHEGGSSWVYEAAFSPDGRYVITAGFDNTARIWEAETGVRVLTLEHASPVYATEFSPDGRHVVTGCWDFMTRVWDLRTGRLACSPFKHSSYPLRAGFGPEGRRIVTTTTQGVVCVWDLAPNGWSPPAHRLVFSADGERFATSTGREVRVWDALTTNAVSAPLQSSNPVRRVLLSRHGHRVLLLSDDTLPWGQQTTVAQLWDTATSQPLSPRFACGMTGTNASGPVSDAKLSDGGERLITIAGKHVQAWDALAGKPLLPPLEHSSSVSIACFNSEGTRLVTVNGRTATLYAVMTNQPLHVWNHQSEVVSHAEFSPDGEFLVTAWTDPSWRECGAQVWNVRTGRKAGSALPHRDGVKSASFSPDGTRVVTASEDFTAQIWDWKTGKRLTPPLKHRHQVYHACFSADGRWVVTASRDKTARVWDAATGDPFTPPLRHAVEPSRAFFIAGGGRIAAQRVSGETYLWDLAPDARPVSDLVLLSQLLSHHQTDQTGGAFPLNKAVLQEHWLNLRSRYPADFATPEAEAVAWHQREAASAEREQQWFGALFHLDRLLEKQPQEATLLERRQRAQAALAER